MRRGNNCRNSILITCQYSALGSASRLVVPRVKHVCVNQSSTTVPSKPSRSRAIIRGRRLAKQQLSTCITLFRAFSLPSKHDYSLKLLISGTSVYAGRERWQDHGFTPLLMNLDRIFQNSTPEKLANILQTEAEGKRTALKFKTARTHFLSECFYVITAALILQIKTVEATEGELVGGKTYIYGQSGKMVRAICVFSFR